MIRFFTLTVLLTCLGSLSLHAQKMCGFDQAHQQLMSSNAAYSQQVQQLNQFHTVQTQILQNALIKNTPNGPVYEIPLVVHVIHTGGAVGSAYNPTDAQINAMINYLNASYAATWPSYPNTSNGGVNVPLRFVLAQRSPSCAAINGINRVNGSSLPGYVAGGVNRTTTLGADDPDVKALSNWGNQDYYNIWIVNKIDGEDGITPTGPYVAGYAYFPGAPASVDGTVMLASQAVAGEITLPHEIGHGMGLYHTFEGDGGGGTCPNNTNCNTQGDRVCDTEPHRRSVFNCPIDPNPCTNSSFNFVQYNFMDYSSCQNRFTAGQSTRAINSLLNQRASLLSSLATLPPAAGPTAACVPTIVNANNGFNFGPRNISFADLTYSSGGYTTDGNQHYRDRTCLNGTYVSLGASYNISVSTGSGISRVRVYIDYNNDGTLDPVNELVFSNNGNTINQTHTGNVTIPNNVTTCVPLRMRVVADASSNTNIGPCSQLVYGQAEDFTIIARNATPANPNVNVAMTSGANPSCLGETLVFTATPSASISGATIHWYVNGVYTGQNGTTFSNNNFANNDVISAYAIYPNGCQPDSTQSNGVTVQRLSTIAATVSIALTSGDNPGCSGQTYTFTATINNGGPTPTIEWKVNGTSVQTSGLTFTSSTLTHNDVVTAEVQGSGGCPDPSPAVSNPITIIQSTLVPDVAINIMSGSNPMCAGAPITFEAIPTNGGSGANYVWSVNGINQANGITYSTTTLANNDVVKVTMFSSLTCANPTTDTATILMTVIPNITPTISIAVTDGLNPGCIDSSLSFEATVGQSGATPSVDWQVNGIAVGQGPAITLPNLVDGDIVTATVVPTVGGCYTSTLVTSNPISIVKNAPGTTPVISFIGNTLIANTPPPMQWYGPLGMIPNANANTYHPTIAGIYFAKYLGTTCPSDSSNLLNVVINLSMGTYDFSRLRISPNPANQYLNIDWKGNLEQAVIEIYNSLGQKLYQTEAKRQPQTRIMLGNLPNGTYYLLIKDESGKTGTTQFTIMH